MKNFDGTESEKFTFSINETRFIDTKDESIDEAIKYYNLLDRPSLLEIYNSCRQLSESTFVADFLFNKFHSYDYMIDISYDKRFPNTLRVFSYNVNDIYKDLKREGLDITLGSPKHFNLQLSQNDIKALFNKIKDEYVYYM
ncbi:hypothetical protein D3C87_1139750 [compost metagenome]